MTTISPSLAARIQQQTAINQVQSANTVTDNGLQQDVVEISGKQKTDTKKALKIGAGIGLAIGAAVALIKTHNLSKAKKELTALYDTIFEKMQKSMPDNFHFEKPELVFEKLDKKIGGGYLPNENKILIDPRSLRNTCIPKDLTGTRFEEITKDLKLTEISYKGNLFDIYKKGNADQYRMATKDEALAMQGSIITHELTHAKQFQYLLSSENGKENFIQRTRTTKKLSEENMREFFPFVYSYKPKQILSQNLRFEERIAGDTKPFRYTFSDILNAFTDYTIKDRYKYYTNLTEISARNAEYLYWHNVAEGNLPKPKEVSEEFLKCMKIKTKYNSTTLRKASRGEKMGI